MASPRSTMPAFDTHKAVKALRQAGFDDVQAEAVVDQINGAITESLVSKADLDQTERNLAARIDSCAARDDLRMAVAPLMTQEHLDAAIANLVTQEHLDAATANLVTKEQLDAAIANLVTKEQFDAALANFATKDELRAAIEPLATKEELAQLELRMTVRMEELTGKMLKYMGGGLALVVALIKGLDVLAG